MEFKVGDIITGLKDTPYNVTNSSGTYRVNRITDNFIEIETISHKYKRYLDFTDLVELRHFELVKPKTSAYPA